MYMIEYTLLSDAFVLKNQPNKLEAFGWVGNSAICLLLITHAKDDHYGLTSQVYLRMLTCEGLL